MRLRRSEMDAIDSSTAPLPDEPAVAGAAGRVDVDVRLDARGYWHSTASGQISARMRRRMS